MENFFVLLRFCGCVSAEFLLEVLLLEMKWKMKVFFTED